MRREGKGEEGRGGVNDERKREGKEKGKKGEDE